ncbi:MAG: hypothetical protein IJ662_04625 [Clostridia bacterium]|nr:hypothetical protein [Clostridia bacterium]
MKKLMSLLVALLMLINCAALAEEWTDEQVLAEENAFLTQEELELYLNVLTGDALAFGVDHAETDPETGVTAITYAGNARLLIADEELSETSAVLGATLNEMQEDLRGIHLGESLADVLSVYPNDNPDLYGTRYDAALYVNDERPEATVGYILRDGQRVSEVTHLIFTWEDDRVIRSGVTYTFDQDMVSGIEIFGLDAAVEESAALEEIGNVAIMQENTEYSAYPVSVYGGDLTAFDESDLTFGGLDFLQLTPESAAAVLGQPQVDDWMEDSTGEYLRTQEWEAVSIVFLYNGQRKFQQVDSLTVYDDVIEGPRAVRIDDTMDSVMNRFLHGQNTQLENGIALYGDGVTAPYGVLAYAEVTATVTYALTTQVGSTVIWQLTFQDGTLLNYRMLLR